jgi:HD-GYP domain-containing protein (c-di-GMP phosphodiesterase class II)
MQRRITDFKKRLSSNGNRTENEQLAVVNALAYAIEARDPYTRGHSERVANYAAYFAQALGLSHKRVTLLKQCCRLHDVGKIGISDLILAKPAALSMEEKAKIDLHPVYGAEILDGLEFIAKGMPVILHHHERCDGKGYPYGLKKDDLTEEVKIISIVDAFDAMTTDRPYRKALPMEKVLSELVENSGKQFDAHLVRVFLKLLEKGRTLEPVPVAIPKQEAA